MSPRKSATWPRASPDGTWKNRLPASEIATAASPAVLKTCIWISRDSPDSAGALRLRHPLGRGHGDAARPGGAAGQARHARGRWPARSRRPPARDGGPATGSARRRPGRDGGPASAARRPCAHPALQPRHPTEPSRPDTATIHQSCFACDRPLRCDDPQQARRRRGRGGRRGPRRPRRGRRRRRRGRAPRLGRRGRAGGQPPVRVHAQGVRRVALVRDGRPRLAPASRDRRRDRAGPRRRGDRGAGVGALPRTAPARRHVARRPAPGRRRRPAAGPDLLLRRRPARQRRQGAGPAGRPGPRPRPGPHPVTRGSRPRGPALGGRRRRAGLTRWPRARPTAATRAASWSGSPARWPTRSASAPTATPTTTAGS